jgi:tetratricopeptide (TPR) repeat protein
MKLRGEMPSGPPSPRRRPGSEEGPLAFAVDKRKTLDAAQKFVQKGAFDKALKEYQKLLQADPKDTNVRLKIGDLHLKKGDQRLAIEAYLQVAEIFSGEGFDAKAVAIYKQVLRIDAGNVEVRVRLGDLYQRLGLPSDALREFQGAARAFQDKGQKREAFEMLKRVAQLDPTNVQNRLSLADLMLRENLRDEARAELEGLLGEVERLQQTEGIERVATALLAQFPDAAAGARSLARVKLAQGHARQAVDHLRRALPRHPDDIPLREVLVEALEATGQRDAVQSVWREVAELYKKRGDNERAREILQLHVPVEPLDDATTSPSLELRLEEAADVVGVAPAKVELVPEDTPALTPATPGRSAEELVREARAQLEFGNLEEADRGARQALIADVTSDAARALLAQIALRKSDYGEALRLQRERHSLAQAGGDGEKLAEAEAAIRELEARKPAPSARPSAAQPARPPAPPPPPPAPAAPVVVEPATPAQPALRPAAKGASIPLRGAKLTPPVEELPDIELVLEDEDSSVETPATPVLAPNADGEEIEIDIGGDASPDSSLDGAGSPPPEPAPEPERAQPARAKSDKGSSKSWSVDSTAIAENLEEAEFYLQQGMVDEAEKLYRKLLEKVPHHPQALVRVGEIEARRGKAETLERPSPAPGRWLEDTAVDADGDADAVPELEIAPPPAVEAKKAPSPAPARAEPPPPPPAAPEIEIEIAAPPPVVEPAQVAVEAPKPVAEPPKVAPPPPAPVIEIEPQPEPEPTTPAIDLGAELLAEDPDLVRPPAPEPEEEGGDFDLAAELSSEEIAKHESTADAFDQVFRAFKKGIEAQIGPDECDAHYDLAIAYREMGLYDDAARELELVVKGGRALEGLTLLAQCKLELGLPEEAIAHVRKAQALPNLGAEAQLALSYELGVALAASGQRDEALAKLREIATVDPAYRDVVDRVNELEKGGA